MDLKPMHVTGPGVCVTSPGIPGTSEESSSASSTRGSFKRKPPVPIVDIQVILIAISTFKSIFLPSIFLHKQDKTWDKKILEALQSTTGFLE